jgi:hypothetical protein
MMIFDYPTKRALKASVGQPLKVIGSPYLEDSCSVVGCNRPELTGFNREFYANVVLLKGLIKEVS